MKRTVLRYGLLSGLMISVLMDCSMLLAHRIGPGYSMLIGYTIMVASFLLVYFGVRSYRDTVLGGGISFGRALGCGLLIMLITTICYVGSCDVLRVYAALHGRLLCGTDSAFGGFRAGCGDVGAASGGDTAIAGDVPESAGEYGVYRGGAVAGGAVVCGVVCGCVAAEAGECVKNCHECVCSATGQPVLG